MPDVTIDAPPDHEIRSVTIYDDGGATIRWRSGRVERFIREGDVYETVVPLRVVRSWFEDERVDLSWSR